MSFRNLYEKDYKKLLIIPLLLLIVSIGFLSFRYANEGYLIDRDFSLKGGVSATVTTTEQTDIPTLELSLKEKFPGSDVSLRVLSDFGSSSITGYEVIATEILKEDLSEFLKEKFPGSDVSIQEVGSSIGETVFNQMVISVIFSFVLMSLVVFITYRKFIPAIAIVLSAFLDIVVSLAVVSFLDFKISASGIAAFLLIIGYSIDTDILLTARLLKRHDQDLITRLLGAFKTGLTMTITAFAAIFVALIVAWNISVLNQMFSILAIALAVDIISTWLMNAPILIWYLKKNENN